MTPNPPTEIMLGGHRYRIVGNNLLEGCVAPAWARAGIEKVLLRHGTPWLDLIVYGRDPKVMMARSEVAAFLHGNGWSLNRIGALMHRHHTTILHMIRMAPKYAARPVTLPYVSILESEA